VKLRNAGFGSAQHLLNVLYCQYLVVVECEDQALLLGQEEDRLR
jgi:hypothetical protein